MNCKKFVLIFLIFFVIFVNVGFTNDKVLTVGVWNNPNLSIIKDSEISGFVVDIFKYIAEKNDIKYKFVAGKWANLYSDLVNGEIDVLIPIAYSDTRLKYMKFTDYNYPVFMNWGVIISKSKNIKTITDLKGKRIAIVKNDIFYTGTFGMETYLKLYNIDYKPVSVSSYEEVLNLVKSGDVDAGLIARNFYNYINDRSIYETFLAFQPVRIVFAFNKKINDNIVNLFDKELQNLINDKSSIYYVKYNHYFHNGSLHKKYVIVIYLALIITSILFLLIVILRKIIKDRTSKLIDINKRLTTILSATPDLILLIAEDGEYLEVLTSNEELLADFRDNLLGKKVKDVIQGSVADKIMNIIQKALDTNEIQIFRYELDVIGGKRFFEGRVKPIDLGYKKRTVLWYAIDITETEKILRELQVEKEKLNSILKSVSEGVVVIDRNKKIIFANKSACEILEIDECVGKSFDDVIRLYKDEERVFLPLDDIFNKGINFEIGKDYKIKTSKNNEKYIDDSLSPLFDSESKIAGAVFVFADITDKMIYEREVLKSDKIDTLGRFAAGLAHDFNNYLSIIKNYNYLILQKENLDDEIMSIAKNIDATIEKSIGITKQLLTFAKGGEPVKELIDLNEVIKEAISLSLSGTGIQYNINFEDDKFIVYADKGQIVQVFVNLFVNAKDAMQNNGKIEVNIRNISLQKENILNLSPGEYVEIRVRDTGPGISEVLMSKIFDPYFTTKEHGNGLGLAICYSVLKRHGGTIYLNREYKNGAEFVILLQKVKEVKTQVFKNENIIETDKKLKILYMDDEYMLRDSFKILLESMGHEVITVSKGEEAIEAIKKDNFDVIILDLTIVGGMGGVDTAKEIRKIKPDAYIVVTSGYSDTGAVANYSDFGFDNYFLKPFKVEELKKILSESIKR
ncbi:hypothetical protein DEFDS_1294 [Deferribacter desulfuricans SSM1]|uniref:histidine kinase n=1 Tax=Deferribacter desulfuricans (strain DSM 14783 / JCM 11476 / NBRC 101012 / SSM1) TaxID=639282 RepID=D3PDT8_DEFDS|nr:transporter substrate-binding domain-containing protein [Deferribacter desulfuricans]BAI80761.1 hypothetical protein DEFDS_1294 [Deferribacter desulfuricans SSM1]